MAGSNNDKVSSHSPKSKIMMEQMTRLQDKKATSSKVDSSASHSESPKGLSKHSHRSHHSEKGERPRQDRRSEEEPHRERRERRYEEELRIEQRRISAILPYFPYVEENKRAPMDAFKCCIPPFNGENENEVRTSLLRKRLGSKSVEEYHRDMEVALTRANLLESSEAIMTQFLHGLN
ncbi:hypothetical protein CR513_45744, partial [Mucuna pruriens]